MNALVSAYVPHKHHDLSQVFLIIIYDFSDKGISQYMYNDFFLFLLEQLETFKVIVRLRNKKMYRK